MDHDRTRVGGWDLILCTNDRTWPSGNPIYRVAVESVNGCFCDYPIQYADGTIAYNWPQRIPATVKNRVCGFFRKHARLINSKD